MSAWRGVWAGLALLALTACAPTGGPDTAASAPPGGPELPALALNQVRSWAIQLQQLDLPHATDELARSPYDLLVLEPTRTISGEETSRFDTAAMVDRLKASRAGDGQHRKLILAYVEVGEAEAWRWYWTWSRQWPPGQPKPADWPAFIIEPDPDGWSDNYPVAFWDPQWKDLLIHGEHVPPDASRDYVSTLDEALRDGFDGVYLDWVEAYSDEHVAAVARSEGLDPAREMVALLTEARAWCHQHDPDFLFVQQNAPELLQGHPELLQAIDGLAQEEVWYHGDADKAWLDPRGYDQPQDRRTTARKLALLRPFLKASVPVFDLEYTVKYADRTYALARDQGLIPYCSRSALARLSTTPPRDPWGKRNRGRR